MILRKFWTYFECGNWVRLGEGAPWSAGALSRAQMEAAAEEVGEEEKCMGRAWVVSVGASEERKRNAAGGVLYNFLSPRRGSWPPRRCIWAGRSSPWVPWCSDTRLSDGLTGGVCFGRARTDRGSRDRRSEMHTRRTSEQQFVSFSGRVKRVRWLVARGAGGAQLIQWIGSWRHCHEADVECVSVLFFWCALCANILYIVPSLCNKIEKVITAERVGNALLRCFIFICRF